MHCPLRGKWHGRAVTKGAAKRFQVKIKTMYIHIGGGEVVKKSRVIGVFDMDTATIARQTKIFLRDKENKGEMTYVTHDIPRSFILCDDKVVICDLNTSTVKNRSKRERVINGKHKRV